MVGMATSQQPKTTQMSTRHNQAVTEQKVTGPIVQKLGLKGSNFKYHTIANNIYETI